MRKYLLNTVPSEQWVSLLSLASNGTSIDHHPLLRDDKLFKERDNSGRGPLTVAADNGRFDLVEALLKLSGSKIELEELKGRVLLGAIYRGNVKLVQKLLEGGAIVDSLDSDLDAPLEAAARIGNIDIFKLIIKAGGIPFRDNPTWSALHCAMAADRLDFVKWAFSEYREQILGSMALIKYLLDWAVVGDAVDVLRWLTNAPEAAEFDFAVWLKVRLIMDRRSTNAAHARLNLIEFICAFGCVELVKWCLDEFAMRDIGEHEIDTAPWCRLPSTPERCALLAIENGHFEILDLLFERGLVITASNSFYSRQLWFLAARVGHIGVLRKNLEAGRDISYLSTYRLTAVSEAAMHGQLEAVQFLVENGAILSDDGPSTSPLLTACDRGHETVAVWLRDYMLKVGLEKDVLSGRVVTACVGGRLFDFIMWLSNRLLNLLEDVENRESLLDIPLLEGQAAFVQKLLDEPSLNISIQSNCSLMTLLQCVSRGHEECVKLIVERGGDDFVNHPAFYTYRHGSLWHSCFQYNSQELWQWLLRHRPTAISSGWAPGEPASMAVQFGRLDMLETLIERFGVSLTDARIKADGIGTTLHLAARICKTPAMITFLLKSLPAALKSLDSFGRTPLLVAAAHSNKEALVTLVKAGAELHVADFSGADLLELLYTTDRDGQAMSYLFRKCPEYFHRQYFRPKHIHMAASKADPGFLAHLLNHVFPDFAPTNGLHDELSLSHIHYLYCKATLHELHDLLVWLARRYNHPEHLPPRLVYELRMYQSLTNPHRWKELYYLGIVGRFMQAASIDFGVANQDEAAEDEVVPLDDSGDSIAKTIYGGKFRVATIEAQLRPAVTDGLIAACLTGNLKLVSLYHKFGASLQRRKPSVGITPILAACAAPGPKLKLLTWLLSKGCCIFDTDFAGNGALQFMAPGDPAAKAFVKDLLGRGPRRPAE